MVSRIVETEHDRKMLRQCSIEGCEGRHLAHGWCSSHYQRWRSHGDPLGGGTRQGDPMRFIEEIAMSYFGDGCLEWPYSRGADGRGQVWYGGKVTLAHRRVCERVHGPAPTPEHEAMHSCGNGHLGCVTRGHLQWGTHQENMDHKILHGTITQGQRNGASKLTEKDVAQIRAMRGRISQRKLAKMFGVAPSTISIIQTGKIWSWLGDAQ